MPEQPVGDHRSHVLRAGTSAPGPFDLEVTPASAGWTHSGLRVLTLAAGGTETLTTDDAEVVVVPLSGGVTVTVAVDRDADGGDDELVLEGRASVFDGPTDVAYAPHGSRLRLHSPGGGRFALCSAVVPEAVREAGRRPAARLDRTDVPVELRGAGQASRQVHNFGVPGVLDADRVIACEVLTPAGNWSSYPPHKHDEERAAGSAGDGDPGETALEEIYYFEVAGGPGGPGVAYQRVYGHGGADIDVLAEVGSGDVVLIPHGWHGPSMAAPGYDLYYLNVMAGSGPERAWLICDDPAHTWVRGTWDDQSVDPRLPFGSDAPAGGER